jgi:hypothetical protein
LHGEAYAKLQTLSMANNFPLFRTCIFLAYSFPLCSDMCVLAILKIAAFVESCGIEPVEWDKIRGVLRVEICRQSSLIKQIIIY